MSCASTVEDAEGAWNRK